jgi:DNA-binding beta-propeller fold protein YncE
VVCSLNGTFYYAANFISNAISVYRVQGTTYSLVANVPTATGPTSIATDPANRYAYVASAGTNSVLAYAINAGTGALTLIGTYPVGGPAGEVEVSPDGTTAWISGGGTISSFAINPTDGTLALMASAPFFGGDMNFHADWPFDPPRQVGHDHIGVWGGPSEACPEGQDCGSHIDQYAILGTGALAYEGSLWWPGIRSPTNPPPHLLSIMFGDFGCEPTSHQGGTGRYYVVNPGANTIDVYYGERTCVDGDPMLSSDPSATVPAGPEPRAIAANGSFAYVINGGNNTVSTFAVASLDDGVDLTPTGTPVATGPDPVAVTLSGLNLYVENAGDNTVSYYSLNPTTGQPTLTNVQ